MASPVTVFYYEKHDPNARRFVRSARPATREVIAKIGARAVSGSALEVDASRLDRKGHLAASRVSRMSSPHQRTLMSIIEASTKTAEQILSYERKLANELCCPKCWPSEQPLTRLPPNRLTCPSCRAVYVVE